MHVRVKHLPQMLDLAVVPCCAVHALLAAAEPAAWLNPGGCCHQQQTGAVNSSAVVPAFAVVQPYGYWQLWCGC